MANPYLEQLRWKMKESQHKFEREMHEERMRLIDGGAMARGLVQTPMSLEPNIKRSEFPKLP